MAKTQNILLFGAALATIGYFVYDIRQKGTQFINDLRFRVKSIKLPSLQSGMATVPLTIEVENPQDVGVTLTNLLVDIGIKQQDGSFKMLASIPKDRLVIAPNATMPVTLQPVIDLNNLNIFQGQSIKDIFNNVFSTEPLATFQIDYSFKVEGIPQEGTEFKTVKLPSII